MPNKPMTIKHITAAKITADIAQWEASMSKMARGTDATARQTGRSWLEMRTKVNAFDKAIDLAVMRHRKGMKSMTLTTRREAKNMQQAMASVNFSRGAMGRGQQMARSMPMGMRRGGGGGGMGGLGSMAAMGGGYMVWNRLQSTKAFDERRTDLQIKAGKSAAWSQGLEKQILRVSDSTGKSKGELLDYVQQFTELTGQADMARNALKNMSDVALASGTPMAHLAGVTEQLSVSLGIADPAKLRQTMAIILQHERIGKVPFQALAAQLGKVTSQGQLFGAAGKGMDAARAMSGLFQLSARGFGAGMEGQAATGSGRFLFNLAKNRQKVEKTFGVSLGSGEGKNFAFKSLAEMFKIIGVAMSKRPDLLATHGTSLFGLQGLKTALQLSAAGKTGWDVGGPGKSAASKFFAATGSVDGVSVIDSSKAKRTDSKSHKWNLAVTRMNNEIHRHMLPILEKAADLMPTIAKGMKFFLEHSDKIVRLWAGYKGAQAFKAMGGMRGGSSGGSMGAMGAGGAMAMGGYMSGPGVIPGSDLDILKRQQHDRMARRRAMMRRGAGYGGMALGAASAMGGTPNYGPEWANMASNMALMSMNPYAMAAGAAYKVHDVGSAHKVLPGTGGDKWGGRRIATMVGTLGASEAYRGLRKGYSAITGESPDRKMSVSGLDAATAALQRFTTALSKSDISVSEWYTDTIAGSTAKKGMMKALGSVGSGDASGFEFNPDKLQALGKPGMTKALGKMKTNYGAIYSQAAKSFGPGATEENVFAARPELEMFKMVIQSLEKSIVGLDKGIKVTAIMDVSKNPGTRADQRNPDPSPVKTTRLN